MRSPAELSIALVLLVVIGSAGCGDQEAGGPVKISMLRTPRGSRPLVWIEPCDKALQPSNVASSQYAMIVERDDQPYYFRTVEPAEIKGGREMDLAIPSIESGKKWSVALERVIRGKETEAISNRLVFDPLDTSTIAIDRPPMPVACSDWIVSVTGPKVSINDQVTFSLPMSQDDAAALLKLLGEPSRRESNVMRTMTWDKLGIYARGDEQRISELGFLLAKADHWISFHPHHRFGGKVVVEGKTIDTGMDKPAFESSSPKNGRVSTLFRRDGKIGSIELENGS